MDIMPRRGLDDLIQRIERLQDHFAAAFTPACTARHLGQDLKDAFTRERVG
jgi:hypothetical protein